MTTEKIQFFMSDLAYKLEVGEIKEIHIAEQNGRKVLRLECEKCELGEYKTVHATKSANSRPKVSNSAAPKTVPEKLVTGVGNWLFDPERKKRQEEFFGMRK